jgi:hypothetical protein
MNRSADSEFLVQVKIDLLAPEHGGRPNAIESGYRPLIRVDTGGGVETVVGLAELALDAPISPGTSGRGILHFSKRVAPVVRPLLRPGSIFKLSEGNHVVATGRVLDKSVAAR